MSGFLFGDPCQTCGAGSQEPDPRDRVCLCVPCAVCAGPTHNSCAYCGRSLGCREHRVTVERHVETFCLATPEQRARFHAASHEDQSNNLEQWISEIQAATPKPWPASVPPWDDALPPRGSS